jgi:hypothetical protein
MATANRSRSQLAAERTQTLGTFPGTATGIAAQFPDLFNLARLIPGILPALPGIQDVAGQVNEFQQGEILDQVGAVDPNLLGAIGQEGRNIASLAQGLIPEDVLDVIQNQTAARNIGGFGGTAPDIIRNAQGRNLGLTSLDLQRQGAERLGAQSGNIRQNLTGPLFDIAQNIPNLESLFNASTSQALANAAERERQANLEIAQEAAGIGSRGGSTINQGVPSFPARGPSAPGFAGGGGSFVGPTRGTFTGTRTGLSGNPIGARPLGPGIPSSQVGNFLPLFPGDPNFSGSASTGGGSGFTTVPAPFGVGSITIPNNLGGGGSVAPQPTAPNFTPIGAPTGSGGGQFAGGLDLGLDFLGDIFGGATDFLGGLLSDLF